MTVCDPRQLDMPAHDQLAFLDDLEDLIGLSGRSSGSLRLPGFKVAAVNAGPSGADTCMLTVSVLEESSKSLPIDEVLAALLA